MIEFLNYVPAEGSFGELLFDFLHVAFACIFCAFLTFCIVIGIKKVVGD